jgi:hypothetical protein
MLNKKIRHNKIKNSAILFESLTRQITSDILNKQDDSPSIKIIKEFFGKDSELKKELYLYNLLLKKKFSSETKASSFIDNVIEARKRLNNSKLKREKYNIIKALSEHFSVDKLFSSKIDNYSIYASIYKLFEYSNNINENITPMELTQSKFAIIESMLKGELSSMNAEEKMLKEFDKLNSDIKLLTSKILIDKFNEKYANKLTIEQKELLKHYIYNVSNVNSLKEYVDSKISKMQKEINVLSNNVSDDIIKIKLKEINNQLNGIKSSKNVKENHLIAMLKIYQLIDELKKATSICGKERKRNEIKKIIN